MFNYFHLQTDPRGPDEKRIYNLLDGEVWNSKVYNLKYLVHLQPYECGVAFKCIDQELVGKWKWEKYFYLSFTQSLFSKLNIYRLKAYDDKRKEKIIGRVNIKEGMKDCKKTPQGPSRNTSRSPSTNFQKCQKKNDCPPQLCCNAPGNYCGSCTPGKTNIHPFQL